MLVGPGGRPPELWRAPPDWVDVVERSKDQRTVTVHAFGRMGEPRATTRFDAAGRPMTSSYTGGHSDEQYVYDSQRRLVEIVESPGLTSLGWGHWRGEDPMGGRLEVLHDEYVEEYLWWCQHDDSTSIVGFADLPVDVQRAAVRAAVMHAPGDPLETLCQAAVPRLAAHDWSALFTPTPDFAVYVIGEDVGAADIYRSMVAGNPAVRLAERAARWRGSPYPPEQ